MKKLSVVIPVYRVEAFLEKCVSSVLAQEDVDLEVILVDDCSPDGCGALCDRLAEDDNRIKVVHRSINGGLSAARNTGIVQATGDLLTFVDSDDWLAPGTYAPNVELMEQQGADCIEFPVAVRHGSTSAEDFIPSLGAPTGTFAEWYEHRGYMHSYAWNKIFRRDLWGDTRFPEGKYFEDIMTVPYVLHRAKRIVASTAGRYYYCVANGEAITQQPSLKKEQDLTEGNIRLFEFAASHYHFSDATLYHHFREILNRQIGLLKIGGDLILPEFKVKWEYAFLQQPLHQRIKCILWLTLGKKGFFKLFAR